VRNDADKERRARFIIAFNALLLPLLVLRGSTLIAAGMVGQTLALIGLCSACIASLWVLRQTGSLVLSGNLVVAAVFLPAVTMSYQRGGIGAPIVVAMAVLPLIAIFIAGTRSGIAWTAIVLLVIGGLGIYEYRLGHALPDRLAGWIRFRVELLGALLFTLFLLGIGLAYEWTKNAALDARATAERERLRAEEAARMLQADRMASVGQLAAGVAHEINNPLGYIAGNLDFLDRQIQSLRAQDLEAMQPELAMAVADARQGVERVASIVRDLKTFVRAGDDKAVIVDLRVVLDASVRIAHNEIRHRARLVREYPEHPIHVLADEQRLVQVFLNLLLNAVHAIAPGDSGQQTIRLAISGRGDQTEVVIADSGCGMAPEVLARAVDPFFTTKPIGVGTGIGLSVCTNVTRAMGGKLRIESEVGRGTTVTLNLPRQELTTSPHGPAQPGPVTGRAALRVLVIDDDPLVARALGRLLKGHEVTTVDRGGDALRLLAEGARFDIILCDLMMPELTGADVYHQVAALGLDIERQIVFLTGGAFTERMRTFLDNVPNACLEKPLRIEHLEALLAERQAV
jgi:signal transduction histidine kinase